MRNNVLEIRAVRSNPRQDWAADAARLAAEGDDALAWPEFANDDDSTLVW